MASLNGKILRLNRDGTIPPDNPFPNSPVYSYGHRNPQGLAWQPGIGLLYATEHGPSGITECCRDEVNLIEPGKNYGWPVISGDKTREGMIAPLLQSGSRTTWAPAGATFVTRDPENPSRVANLEASFERRFGRLRDVAEGPDGALYLLTSNRDGRGHPDPDDDRVIRLVFR